MFDYEKFWRTKKEMPKENWRETPSLFVKWLLFKMVFIAPFIASFYLFGKSGVFLGLLLVIILGFIYEFAPKLFRR